MTSDTRVLRLRKHADKSTGRRVTRFDPDTGEKKLVNPDTPGDDHEPWPLAGIGFEDGPPEATTINVDKVNEGISEGWISAEGGVPVVRPAGPTQDVWVSTQTGNPHFFMHYDALVFHTVDGDVRYAVTHQPDKYADHSQTSSACDPFDADDDTKVTPSIYSAGATRVDHFYGLELEG